MDYIILTALTAAVVINLRYLHKTHGTQKKSRKHFSFWTVFTK
ncbi:hypothetical protein NSB24_01680 [Blautia coccoides]|nr:hypothetical protein [Blautia coccoides]MCR1984946.1 hypothetical protein [Blautia coccoides]